MAKEIGAVRAFVPDRTAVASTRGERGDAALFLFFMVLLDRVFFATLCSPPVPGRFEPILW